MATITRRRFIVASSVALASGPVVAASSDQALRNFPRRRSLLGFSKPFTHFGPEETAGLVSSVGWDGIECPIRARDTHVRPERVEEDLPPLLEALKRRGKTIEVVATDIVRLDARAEKLLRTLARLGIKTYRFGFVRYAKDRPPADTLRDFAAALRDLSALNRELGLQGGYQNHSGAAYLGATLWELWLALKELDAATVGLCFDLGQAMVDGGLSWETQVRLLESRWLTMQVKDFVWDSHTPKGWDIRWCPLGDGRVTKPVLEAVGARRFVGPIIQHHEHLRPGLPRAELLPILQREFATLRAWLV